MGSLDIPNQAFLNQCLPLESSGNVKSNIIPRTVDDVLRQLGTKQENFALLLTDAARYMPLAGKNLRNYTLLRYMSLALHTCYINSLCDLVLSLKIFMT